MIRCNSGTYGARAEIQYIEPERPMIDTFGTAKFHESVEMKPRTEFGVTMVTLKVAVLDSNRVLAIGVKCNAENGVTTVFSQVSDDTNTGYNETYSGNLTHGLHSCDVIALGGDGRNRTIDTKTISVGKVPLSPKVGTKPLLSEARVGIKTTNTVEVELVASYVAPGLAILYCNGKSTHLKGVVFKSKDVGLLEQSQIPGATNMYAGGQHLPGLGYAAVMKASLRPGSWECTTTVKIGGKESSRSIVTTVFIRLPQIQVNKIERSFSSVTGVPIEAVTFKRPNVFIGKWGVYCRSGDITLGDIKREASGKTMTLRLQAHVDKSVSYKCSAFDDQELTLTEDLVVEIKAKR